MTNWIVTHTDRFGAAVAESTCNRLSQFGASDAAFTNGEWEFQGVRRIIPRLTWIDRRSCM